MMLFERLWEWFTNSPLAILYPVVVLLFLILGPIVVPIMLILGY